MARSHPFTDGTKRTAWVLARLFLSKNGVVRAFDERDAIATVVALAAGELPEDELANWFRSHIAAGQARAALHFAAAKI